MLQFTVSVKVVVFVSDPEVALTVTVDETGGGVDIAEELPPQPLSRLSPTTLTASNNSICKRRRFLHPRQHSATANIDPGSSGRPLLWSSAVVESVDTVSVVEVVPGGITVVGEKLHDAPAGNPEQLNETAELNPYSGVTVMVVLPFCPAVTVNSPGEAAMEKFGVMV
jgi:hypothetical protein